MRSLAALAAGIGLIVVAFTPLGAAADLGSAATRPADSERDSSACEIFAVVEERPVSVMGPGYNAPPPWIPVS